MSLNSKDTDLSKEYNSPESWEIARGYAGLLGEVSSMFSSAIRSLLSDYNKDPNTLSRNSLLLASRLTNGDSMKAVFYYLAKTFKEEELQKTDYLSAQKLISLFKPHESASALGLIYLYRKAKRKAPEEEMSYLTTNMNNEVEIGIHFGNSLPTTIGAGNGILIGGIRQVAYSTFLMHDQKGFKEYRRYLKNNNLFSDSSFEQKKWGCTSAQISSLLIQSLGFGITFADGFTYGLNYAFEYRKLKSEAYLVRIARIWIESLMTKGIIPEMKHRGNYYPLEKERNLLIRKTEEIRGAGSKYNWLDKGKESVNPEETPELFIQQAKSDEGQKDLGGTEEVAQELEELES